MTTERCLFVFLSFRYLLFGVTGIGMLFGHYDDARKLVETRPAMMIWFLICTFLFAAHIYLVQRTRSNIRNISNLLNIISGVWLLTILIPTYLVPYITSITKSQQVSDDFDSDWVSKINSEPCDVSVKPTRLPDIYYIILDEYARDDVLQNIYQVDNSDFLLSLEQMRFYIARDSRANYKLTSLSLNSSLNFNYIDQLSEETGLDAISKAHLHSVISNNRTFHQIRCLGYEIISFETGFFYTDITTTDTVYSPARTPSSFENIVIGNTPLMILMLEQPYNWHRERITYTLKKLPELAGKDSPKFVFVHVLSPHPPFVFGPNGELKNPQMLFTLNDGNHYKILASETEYIEGYREQVIYLSKLVNSSIQGILENSVQPPIIIVQGDHGPALHYDDNILEKTDVQERFPILNAYYLPGLQEEQILYPNITPVNTFRIIFNVYFESDYPLLEDKSFYSPDNDIYNLIDVTNNIADNPRQ